MLEIDEVSSAALIEAGATGPGLEEQLREHELTLRHFPQSFEYSTLGGWIATRAGGHFATLWTHIEDLVESVRAITPSGVWESRRLPGSGAGISPDRMLAGSEGVLGGDHPGVGARPAPAPLTAARAGSASRPSPTGPRPCGRSPRRALHPANCRLLDGVEAELMSGGESSATRCWCWDSSRPTTRSRRRWSGRWCCAPSTEAAIAEPQRHRRRGGDRPGRRLGAAGSGRELARVVPGDALRCAT